MTPAAADESDDEPIPTKEELAARAATFRWPPSSSRGGSGSGSGVSPELSSPRQSSFSPPSAAHTGRPLTSTPAHLHPSTSPLPILERVWLDLIAPPLPQRMAQLGWSPDPPTVYCHRCAATVGPHEATPDGCPACQARRIPWSRAIRLGEYNPPLSHFIQEVKFTQWRRLGRDLGRLLAAAAIAPALQSAGRDPAHLLVIPVPTTFRRRMVRGIDHTRILAAAAARSLHAPLRQPLRRRHRPSQLDVPPSERSSNVSGTFRLARPGVLHRLTAAGPAATIVVIDDVTTTGATLRATCSAIAQVFRETLGAERPNIWVAVAAWTPPAGATRRGPSMTPPDPSSGPLAFAPWT